MFGIVTKFDSENLVVVISFHSAEIKRDLLLCVFFFLFAFKPNKNNDFYFKFWNRKIEIFICSVIANSFLLITITWISLFFVLHLIMRLHLQKSHTDWISSSFKEHSTKIFVFNLFFSLFLRNRTPNKQKQIKYK